MAKIGLHMPSRHLSTALSLLALLVATAPAAAAPSKRDQALQLGRALLKTRDRDQARDLVSRLAALELSLAHQALALHVKRKGLADREAFQALSEASLADKQGAFLARAAQANGEDPVSLGCIREVALVPGEEVTRLLERLASDWSPKVKAAATEALARRGAAGLSTASEIKEVPYGSQIGELLREKGSFRNTLAAKTRKKSSRSSRSAADRERGRKLRYTKRVYPRGKPSLDSRGDPMDSRRPGNKPRRVPAPPAREDASQPGREPLETSSAQEDSPAHQYEIRR